MDNDAAHRPVLLEEALSGLAVRADGLYVDATFGRGGHAAAVLDCLGPDGRLWLVDRDPDAIAEARERFASDGRCRLVHASFDRLPGLLDEAGLSGRVSGLLMDLGVSSPQLDTAERGFSFLREGPLDMRMDTTQGETARDWLARAEERDISRVLREYGEERYARRIARAIVRVREAGELPATTRALAALIDAAAPSRERSKHPATRSFQAIRMKVNGELDSLAALLERVNDLLEPGGRLVVISFHSLEDRLVKRFMRRNATVQDLPPEVPVVPPELRPKLKLVSKAVRASEAELAVNPRSRSAVLRVAERLP